MAQRRVALEMVRFAKQSSAEALRGLLSHIADHLPDDAPGAQPFDTDWRVMQAFDLAAGMVRDPSALARLLRRDHATLIKDRAFFQVEEMVDRLMKPRDDEARRWHTHEFLITCGIHQAKSGHMLRFAKMFKEGPIEGYVVVKPERLRVYGYEGESASS